MHRTQTCTMAEFVWLHIHLENLQLRLFSYKTYVLTRHIYTHPQSTRTYAHMH